MDINGIWLKTGQEIPELKLSTIPFSLLIGLLAVVSLVALLLYKNRRIQMRVVLALILLSVIFFGLTVYYLFFVTGTYNAEIIPGLKMIVPPVVLLLAILSYRGIKKDENLVKSYDRLR